LALKGGNNNFGIVTEIEFTTFEQGLIWTGTVYNPVTSVDGVISEFVNISSADVYDEFASFITTFVYNQARGISVVANNLDYTKEVEGVPSVYQGIYALPNFVNTSQIVNMTSLSKATAALNPDGARSFSVVTTLVSTTAMIKAAYNQWSAVVPVIANVSNIVFSLSLEPLPLAFYGRHANDNALGLAGKTKPLVVTLVTVTWTNAADDTLVTNTSNSLLKAINDQARQLGDLDDFIYLNYAGQFQDPISSYGAQSVSKLQEVRKRVDPEGVFTYQVPGGYKVPNPE